MDLDPEMLFSMYKKMLSIRHFEMKTKELFEKNLIRGGVHLYIGQEAIAVGVASALREDDCITSTHRGHGHCIAKGGEIKLMLAELMGKETGLCKGKGGSMHLADLEKGILGANAIVAGSMAMAAGAALAFKKKRLDRVVVSFFGEGGITRGYTMRRLTWPQSGSFP